MLRRKMTNYLERWKSDPKKKALLIKGARQVGKTFIVDEFAKKNYESYIYINFEERPELKSIFEGNLDIRTLMHNISAQFLDVPIIPKRTMIFLDEIQSCPGARTAIRFMVRDGRFDIVASGSLLGLNYKDVSSYPAGDELTVEMYSLDFEEFLWALGVTEDMISDMRCRLNRKEQLDPFILNRFDEYFRWYMIVGGMPAAVEEFIDRHDFGRVRQVQKTILNIYKADISKYAKGVLKSRARVCLLSVPEQMGGKFRYKDVEGMERSGYSAYGNSLNWLVDAGIVFKCTNVSGPTLPLAFNIKYNVFKVFMSDSGILTAMMEKETVPALLRGDNFVNGGVVAENAVAGELVRKGTQMTYFERKGRLEVDFVLSIDATVTAVEVKSGNNTKAKSLDSLMSEKYGVPRGIKLERTNVRIDEKGVEHYPLFAAAFIFPDDSDYVL
jgi:predicted AAA+ superfamily ATPase